MKKRDTERSFFGGLFGLFGSVERKRKEKKHSQTIGRFNLLPISIRRT